MQFLTAFFSKPRRLFVIAAGAGLGGLLTFLLLSPSGISKFALELEGTNVQSPVAKWGEAGNGLSWEAPLHLLEAGEADPGERRTFRAELPVSALVGKIVVTVRPASPAPPPASIRKLSIPDLPKEVSLKVSGEGLWRSLEADTEKASSPTWKWCGVLPRLENGLLVLCGAAAGAVLFGLLARLFSEGTALNWSLAVISAGLLLLLVELFLHRYLPPPNRYYPWKPHQRALFHPDPALMPGIEGDSNFIVNSRGIRGDEFSGDDEYRILAIGGSTTECKYLDQSEAWPQLLQELLNRKGGGSNFWVGNIGQSGRTTREHLVQTKYLLPQLPEIDAVILLAGINDFGLRLMKGDEYDPAYLDTAEGEEATVRRAFAWRIDRDPFLPYYRRSAVGRLLESFFRAERPGPGAADQELIEDKVGGNYARRRTRRQRSPLRDQLPDLSSALDEYGANLNAIVDLIEDRGLRLIMVTQPTIWRPDLTPEKETFLWVGGGPDGKFYYSVEALASGMAAYNRRMIEVCRERGIECLDIADGFPRDLSVFYDDAHFNENGARLMAEKLAEYLLTRPFF